MKSTLVSDAQCAVLTSSFLTLIGCCSDCHSQDFLGLRRSPCGRTGSLEESDRLLAQRLSPQFLYFWPRKRATLWCRFREYDETQPLPGKKRAASPPKPENPWGPPVDRGSCGPISARKSELAWFAGELKMRCSVAVYPNITKAIPAHSPTCSGHRHPANS